MASTGSDGNKGYDMADNSNQNSTTAPDTVKDDTNSLIRPQTTDGDESVVDIEVSNTEGNSHQPVPLHAGSGNAAGEEADSSKKPKLDKPESSAGNGDLTKGDNLTGQGHQSPKPSVENDSPVRMDTQVSLDAEGTTPSEESSDEILPDVQAKDLSASEGNSAEELKTTPTDSNQDQLKVELPPLEGATASCSDAPAGTVYHIKWIHFKSGKFPIITQNENGPCPLLAIINVLLLQGRVKLASMMEMITADQLMTYLGDCILENVPKDTNEAVQLNFEQNMHDAMAVIHKLQTGLDVNVKFTGVRDFEYTPECIIFDLLEIALYHGWLVDPQDATVVNAIAACSYNQLVEKIIADKASDKEKLITEALLAEAFLDRTAAQLTYHGLCELSTAVKEGELCVFFRNNHFSTLYRHKNELFLLVTDQGFLTESNVVWETLSNVEGDCHFVDGSLHTYTKPEASAEPIPAPHVNIGSEEQIDQDFLVALSLQHDDQVSDEVVAEQDAEQQVKKQQKCDHDLAIRLQEEENRRAAAAQAAQQQREPQSSGSTSRRHRDHREPREQRGRDRDREREREKEKDCRIL